MRQSKAFRLIVIAVVLVAVAGVWSLKNLGGRSAENSEEVSELKVDTIDLVALSQENQPVIIDFGADWCSPCRAFMPIYEAMHSRMQDQAILLYVDVDKSGQTAADFPVQVIPTQVFYAAGGAPYVPSSDLGITFDLYAHRETGEHIFTVHQGPLTEEELTAILRDMGAEP